MSKPKKTHPWKVWSPGQLGPGRPTPKPAMPDMRRPVRNKR
jgi:hypothetical protein